jgi:hypothetical protein
VKPPRSPWWSCRLPAPDRGRSLCSKGPPPCKAPDRHPG